MLWTIYLEWYPILLKKYLCYMHIIFWHHDCSSCICSTKRKFYLRWWKKRKKGRIPEERTKIRSLLNNTLVDRSYLQSIENVKENRKLSCLTCSHVCMITKVPCNDLYDPSRTHNEVNLRNSFQAFFIILFLLVWLDGSLRKNTKANIPWKTKEEDQVQYLELKLLSWGDIRIFKLGVQCKHTKIGPLMIWK